MLSAVERDFLCLIPLHLPARSYLPSNPYSFFLYRPSQGTYEFVFSHLESTRCKWNAVGRNL